MACVRSFTRLSEFERDVFPTIPDFDNVSFHFLLPEFFSSYFKTRINLTSVYNFAILKLSMCFIVGNCHNSEKIYTSDVSS